MGHVIQLRREGIEASAPMFIPFLGRRRDGEVDGRRRRRRGAGRARRAGPRHDRDAVPLGIWLATGEEFWQALAYVGFFLNLFNLLPVLPLDGGRAMAALSPWVWFVGFAGLVALTFAFPNPILILILLLGGFESWRALQGRATRPSRRPSTRSRRATRVIVAVVYLGLAAAARARRLRDASSEDVRRRLRLGESCGHAGAWKHANST